LYPHTISIIPDDDKIITAWKKDYNIMRTEMIYGETLSFEDLLIRLEDLQNRFRTVSW